MKIQYISIIFIIILLPIILVLSAYMSMQIDNLTVDLQYDTKLFESALDGMQAFELNTVNNRFSQIADSLKRDVEAGINTYISSLANSMGYGGTNKEFLLPYLPATLFTLYDGYYIYAPTYAEQLDEIPNSKDYRDIDGNPITVVEALSKEPKVFDYEHLLKPYIYYTTRYTEVNENTDKPINNDLNRRPNMDFIVNYTLDNYMIIYGFVNGKYVTRSGFLNVPENITFTLDEKKLDAVLAKKILDYILPPRSLENATQQTILDTYESLHQNNKIVLQPIDRLALINTIGKTLYDAMVDKGSIEESKLTDKQIIEALFDSTINEVYEVNRTVLQSLLKDLSERKDELGDAKILVDEMIKNGNLSGFTGTELFNLIADKPLLNGAIDRIDDIDEVIDVFTEVKFNGITISDSDAKRYYIKSLRFSEWVNNNLSSIKASDAVDDNYRPMGEFNGDHRYVFATRKNNKNNPLEEKSDFNQHRMLCIRYSIQSNLNTAIAQYNVDFFQEKTYSLKMPILNQYEWGEVSSNISMVAFLQGLRVGNKIYNDYVVVSSNKNKETVNERDIYFIDKNELKNDITYYHKIDCQYLNDGKDNIIGLKNIDCDVYKEETKDGTITYLFSDRLKAEKAKVTDIDYDNTLQEYAIRGCYHCIVNRNYPTIKVEENRLKALYTAMAKEKNNLYKVNEYYNVDILSEEAAPPTTVLNPIAIQVHLGDYVTYTAGGYNNWRVLSKDETTGIVEIISDGTVQTVALNGGELGTRGGFQVFRDAVEAQMRRIVEENYINTFYADSGRVVGSKADGSINTATQETGLDDIGKMRRSNALATNNDNEYSSGYWLLSAAAEEEGTSYLYRVMYVSPDGKTLGKAAIYNDSTGTNATARFGLRPIISLKPELVVIGGSGSQSDPWILSFDEFSTEDPVEE